MSGGVRQHQCSGCGKAFATSSGLKQHQHIHSSVKPFRCDVCHKAYTQFSNLCRHKRMHADCRQRIRCPDCDQTFATTTSLAKHRRFCDGVIRPTAVSSRRNHHQYYRHAKDGPAITAVAPDCATKHLTGPSETSAVDVPDAQPLLQSLVSSCGWGTSGLPYQLPLMKSQSSAFNCGDRRDTGVKHEDDELIKKSQLIGMSTKQPSDFGIRRLLDCRSSKDKNTNRNGNDDDDDDVEHVKEPPPSSDREDCDSDNILDDELQDEPLDLSTRATARETSSSSIDGRSQRLELASPVSETSPVTVAADRSPSDDGNFDASSLCGNSAASPFQHTELERSLMLPSISLPSTLLSSLFYEQLQQQQRQTWIDKTADIHPFDVLQKTAAFGSKMLNAQSKPLPVDFLQHQSTLGGLLSRPGKSYAVGIGTSLPALPIDLASVDVHKDGRRQSSMSSQRHQQPHRYGCRFCGKMFPRSANLTRHLRTHTGEQPYRCCYCERSFSISSNLQRHVRNIHNRERPFSCPLCERCFGQQTNLDRHLKKHEFDASTAAATATLGGVGQPAVRERSPPGRDIAGESYLLELRRFVVRACGIDVDDVDHRVTSVNGTATESERQPEQYRPKSPSQTLIWSPARQPPLSSTLRQDDHTSEIAEPLVEVADGEQSGTSSGVEDSHSPTSDGDGALFSPLSDHLRLVPNIKSPIQSVVC